MRASSWSTALVAALAGAPALAQPAAPPADPPRVSAATLDRYGAETASPPPPRYLDWAGKTQPAVIGVQPTATALPPPRPKALAAPWPTSGAQAAAGSGSARYYTIHRAYGLQPDPIPTPPQFYGPTADLSQAPAPSGQKAPAGPSAAGVLALQPVTASAQ